MTLPRGRESLFALGSVLRVDLSQGRGAPDAQLIYTGGNERVAVGQKGQSIDGAFVFFERRNLLSRSQVPNGDKSVERSDCQPATVG